MLAMKEVLNVTGIIDVCSCANDKEVRELWISHERPSWIQEERDVAIVDIQGAYLYVEFLHDKRVVLKLKDILVYIITDMDPEFKENVIFEQDNK